LNHNNGFLKKINIAIDGYSSCGKSTLAKELADKFHYIYVDSGAMYRAITLYALESGIIKDNFFIPELLIEKLDEISITFSKNLHNNKNEVHLNGKNVEDRIRQMDVASNVSAISTIKEVRKKLRELQQHLGENKGVVMDGRDIGTAVFPGAELKIFVTADIETRTTRRLLELKEKHIKADEGEVHHNLVERDYIDTHRAEDPLKKAPDALVIDNSNLSRQEQLELAVEMAHHVIYGVE
jgi:CMP/dCMP kinase